MTDEIVVKCIQIHNGSFIDSNRYSVKPVHQVITIGRDPGNDIVFSYPFISRQHGRIFVEQGFFTEHLDYEDYSSYGSNVIRWNKTECKSDYVHKKKVKIKPGDWIVIAEKLNDGITSGMLLIPYIK